jgi:hypothetical protein
MGKTLEILKKIWEFVNSKTFLFIIVIGVIMFMAFILQQNNNLKNEIIRKEQNITALNDTIKVTKQKNGELQYSITSFITTEKELKETNKHLYDLVKQQEGKVISLANTIVELRQDSVSLSKALKENHEILSKINDSIFISNWSKNYVYDKNNFDLINGRTMINFKTINDFTIQTDILSKKTQIDISFGYKMMDDKRLHVFIQSAYPGFTTKSLEGVYIDGLTVPGSVNKRHWFTGLAIGPSLTYGYAFGQKKWIPLLGVSITYPIYQW